MIKINIDNKDLEILKKQLQKKFDTMPLMKKIGGLLLDAVEENFEKEGRPEKWKKSIRAQLQGGKTLQDTGRLAKSIVLVYDKKKAVVGTNLVYAAIHQFGGKAGRGLSVNMPARPYLQLTDKEISKIIKAGFNFLEIK